MRLTTPEAIPVSFISKGNVWLVSKGNVWLVDDVIVDGQLIVVSRQVPLT
jgi:hypothetical protein